MKTLFRNIHLYLSLVCGIVIAIVCFSGAALVFEKEAQFLIYPNRYFVEPEVKKTSLDKTIENLKTEFPEAKISSVKVYENADQTTEINYSIGKGEGRENNSTAFMNPYSGKLIETGSSRNSFFQTMFGLHRWLLADDTGKLIVGISTFVFLFILITGIVLWWPKNKESLKNRLLLNWSGGWKRINHDLHITVGFYSALFLFAFAFTGLAWSFKWFNDGIYWITGTENKQMKPPSSVVSDSGKQISLEEVYKIVKSKTPDSEFYTINKPKDKDGVFSVTVFRETAAHERATDQIFVDQYSGAVVGENLYENRNLGQRVRSIFYPIHVGSIGGFPGRLIAFLVCIAGVTFPITGVVLWLNRLKRKQKFSD